MELLVQCLHCGDTETDTDGSGDKFGDMTESQKCRQLKASELCF